MVKRPHSHSDRAATPGGRPRGRFMLGALRGAVLALCTLSAASMAAPMPWQTTQLDYVADHKDLKDVLRDVSASSGVPTWISPQVQGNVSGHFQTSPQALLDRLAGTFGFVYYFDGAVLRIYGANEITSATIGLTEASTAELRASLARLGVADRRFPLHFDDSSRTVIVSGPPRYVELVTDVAHLVDAGHTSQQADQVVRLFPLRYAWASDHQVSIDGQSITIRGVSTILRSLYDPDARNPSDSQTAPQSNSHRLRSVGDTDGGSPDGGSRPRQAPAVNDGGSWTTGLQGLVGGTPADATPRGLNPPLPRGVQGVGDASDAAASDNTARQMQWSGQPGDRPVIQPDPRTNSILVRAQPRRMAAFASLIASLDTRPAVLEIDASIIEITDDALQQLGVDWRVHDSHVDFELGNGLNAQAGNPGSLNPQGFNNPNNTSTLGVLGTPAGGVFTAVIGGAGKYLLSRVTALEQTNQATINASPKVATLDNVEAVMDNKKTFYVPVSGYQSADLYSISAGVSLRVLPMIVRGTDSTRIRLNVHIEDGQLTSDTVSNLPVVSNSTIDTQALINEGESLLIAGYAVDQQTNGTTGVPGLSKIPWIGGLFRYKSNQGQKFQRLFLVTPHVINAPAEDLPG
ncbi:type III secretion system outer membrane ring subunit SctC [Caballeronia sp. SEWSISQ10-4 2]|uniref:type III secretion system outer membrane ring subunit SctC n=1 Tax=Caballeronia sp. SEWSISQ10-4 2 TaxID=2937438 RepID=UPI00264FFC9A|nr:type III secretion system outer membrane ring subunit SctC [Caballeronia sp. SEWSISQ10-4 2]MDN7177131.1 type III secretion system outer membrane ring subunit SctC [Caballeronia sp. SEWSISQ10-4 2]